MAKKKQTERVLDYIREFGSVSQLEAYHDLGITRLAARISDLCEEGYDFNRTTESALNRYGEKTYFTRYSLKGEES